MKIRPAFIHLVTVLVVIAGGVAHAEKAKPAQPAKGADAAAGAETPAVAKLEIPRSEFVIPVSPQEGRDPFYPDSMRLFASQAKSNPDKGVAKQASAVLFSLKAITSSGSRRVASINNRPFENGEEGELSFGTMRVRIRCVEIREDSVTIEVDGQTQELRLRSGI